MVGSEPTNQVTKRLGVDHRRLDAVFAESKRRLAAGIRIEVRLRFDLFREGLEYHREERIPYPMTDRLAREAGTLDAMLGRLRACQDAGQGARSRALSVRAGSTT